ncbi:heparinase II/III family protein [Schleiferiaceae bacterium]|nr:heparinase II/III family protein [Schleiferiaceae bacterium]
MDFHQVKRLYHTLKHLKYTQVYHQVKYRLVKPQRLATPWEGSFAQVDLVDFPEKQKSLSLSHDIWSFSFLNLEKSFSGEALNWSFSDYGMLWTYNLNYFDWLHQPGISKEQGFKTLSQFYATPAENNPIILHPYPTSLRIINTAKFISKWDINEEGLYHEVVSDLKFLSGRLEYHLLANHLLENAFALYIGGLITDQKEITEKGKKLLIRELKEQVLVDGMHYERSPMYHLIILERLLDAHNFAKAVGDDLQPVLKSYAVKMTGLALNWKDLDRIPMMQDSAYDIALSVFDILEYSKRLLEQDYPSKSNDLMDSGYRRLDSGNFTLFANVGSISPSYQPGHAHADELNFELFYEGAPLIVDTGVSTYEKNDRRLLERSTGSHNCVVSDSNSSDVWSGFRVGKRANVKIALDDHQKLKAEHDGFGTITARIFDSNVTGEMTITDELVYQSNSKGYYGKGFLHFHPDVHLEQIDEATFSINNQITLSFKSDKYNPSVIELENYSYSKGYNTLLDAKVISYSVFEETKIHIREAS